jgi:hypothetical protein
MKRSLLLSFAAVSLFACGPDALAVVGEEDTELDGTETYDAELTSSSRSSTWFPLQSGNSWTFKSTSGTTRTVTLTQVGDGMGLLTGLFANPTWVGLTSNGSTSLQMWTGSSWTPFVRFGYASTTWRTSSTLCTGLIGRRLSTGTVISTTAGSFSDTRTISFAQVSSPTVLCAPQAFNELSFVPNVGLVAFRTGSGQRFSLVSARVNGRTFPVAPEANITARVALDQANYVSIPNTIRCITTPCDSNAQTATANVSFELRNTGSSSKTWQFSTGCQFDVELLSSSGEVVRRLSEGRACTFALTSVTLGAGQSKVYSARIPLEDRTGLQLDGVYSVRAKLIPSSNTSTAPSATGSLSVAVLIP